MSTNTQESTSRTQGSVGLPQIRSGPMLTGSALVAIGGVIALAGVALGGAHLLSATRRWIEEMEVPPNELAKIKWAQAKSAAVAGSAAWQNGVQARQGAGT